MSAPQRSFRGSPGRIHHRPLAILVLLCLVSLSSAQTQTTNAPAGPNETEKLANIKLEPAPPETKNKIGLSYRMGLNITVDFQKLGGLALSNPGAATGGRVNRNYDDGYNRVDSSTNAGNQTWYWGYQSSRSIQGSNLVLQSYSTLGNATSNDRDGDPQHGFEISYQRELFRKKHWRFGAEAALGYSLISISDNHTLRNTVFRTNDTFSLNGIIPPLAPYNGTFAGPGALLSSDPSSRTTDLLARQATITGDREIDAHVLTIRLGPYLEIPLNERLSIFANGGLTLGVGYTKFNFNETVVISDPTYDVTLTSQKRSASGSRTDFLVGAYAGAGVSYALTKQIGLFTSAIYQAVGHTTSQDGGKVAILDLGKSIIVSVGVTYSF